MYPSIYALPVIAFTASLSLAAISGPAHAEVYSNDVMTKCAQIVGPMKFEGWPADRNREMMMMACQQAGGHIPGAAEERPVALPRHTAPRRHAN